MSPQVVNVCFHGIGTPGPGVDDAEARYWVTRDAFFSLLDEVATWPDTALSFDDGNASDVEVGLPALQERGLTATFFVLAGRLDAPGSLATEQVRALVAAGMGVGSHGMDHVSWRRMPPDVRQRELVEARERLGAIAGHVDQAALPRGQYDRGALLALRRLGYRTVFTSDRRPARRGAWLQPRFSVTRDDTPASFRRAARDPRPWPTRVELGLRGVAKRVR
jgi:peptidoglycan/xylan/chitin deacetylase (PgdA/CDA1 family)